MKIDFSGKRVLVTGASHGIGFGVASAFAKAGADLVIVDCIEFNERFRYGDPVADMAFLVMDFSYHGRADLGRAFADAYFQFSGDGDGRQLPSESMRMLRTVLDGVYPGIELKEASAALGDWPIGGLVTGIPTAKPPCGGAP